MIYAFIGGIEAVLGGSIVGLMCGPSLQAKIIRRLIVLLVWEPCITRDISAYQPGYPLFGRLSTCSSSYCRPSRFKAAFDHFSDSDALSNVILERHLQAVPYAATTSSRALICQCLKHMPYQSLLGNSQASYQSKFAQLKDIARTMPSAHGEALQTKDTMYLLNQRTKTFLSPKSI